MMIDAGCRDDDRATTAARKRTERGTSSGGMPAPLAAVVIVIVAACITWFGSAVVTLQASDARHGVLIQRNCEDIRGMHQKLDLILERLPE